MVIMIGKVFFVYSFEMCKIIFFLNRYVFYSYIVIKLGDGDICIRDVRLGFLVLLNVLIYGYYYV